VTVYSEGLKIESYHLYYSSFVTGRAVVCNGSEKFDGFTSLEKSDVLQFVLHVLQWLLPQSEPTVVQVMVCK
jgi:hypothetical protein